MSESVTLSESERESQSSVRVSASVSEEGGKRKVLRLPRNLHIEVTKIEVHQVLRVLRNPHFEAHKVLRLPRSLQTSHMSKSHVEDHHRVQSTAPATKSAARSTTAPIPCTCHESSTLDHQNTRFPLRLPPKVTTMSENAHGTTTRAQSRQAPAPANQILRACAVKIF